MALPHIVFAHSGRQQYFLDARAAAARFGRVHVLDLAAADRDPEDFARCRGAYVHLSGKSVTYELEWCIRRYFLLRDWMKAEGAAEAWLVDGDVILVGPLPERADFPPGVWSALSFQRAGDPLDHHASPHCSFWTPEALDSFCAFVTDLYGRGAPELIALDAARKRANVRGAISDMTLLHLWAGDDRRVFDLHEFVAGGMLDHNMRHLEQPWGVALRATAGSKALSATSEGVFAEAVSGDKILMRCLHFQGQAKILIHDFVEGNARRYALKAHARHWWGRGRLALRRIKGDGNAGGPASTAGDNSAAGEKTGDDRLAESNRRG